MKKIVLMLAAVVALTVGTQSASFAQSPYNKGQLQLNGGFGFSGRGIPVYFGLDYAVVPDFTLGGEFAWRGDDHKDNRYNLFSFSVNGNYHFNRLLSIPRNWDLYAGLNVGFHKYNYKNDWDGGYNSGLGLGAQIGGRYYFNETIGLNLELGGGNRVSGGKIGLSFRL